MKILEAIADYISAKAENIKNPHRHTYKKLTATVATFMRTGAAQETTYYICECGSNISVGTTGIKVVKL